MDKLIVGKIIKIHGIKGAVKIDPVIDDDIKFSDLQGVFIGFEGKFHEFEEVFAVSNVLGVKFKDINSVDEANKIVGEFVLADKNVLENLVENDSFFIEELKGSNIYFDDGTSVGVLEEIDNFGSADIFYIESKKYKNLSVPHIDGLIVEFNESNKKLIISKSKFDEVAVYDD